MGEEYKRDLIFDITGSTRVLMAWCEYDALLRRLAQAEEHVKVLEAQLEAVGDYAGDYNSTWWRMFDDPDCAPLPFAQWWAQTQPPST